MTSSIQAVVSNLPITELEPARQYYKFMANLQNKKVRVRYRGPRRKSHSGRISFAGQMTCLKQDAKTFSVYFV